MGYLLLCLLVGLVFLLAGWSHFRRAPRAQSQGGAMAELNRAAPNLKVAAQPLPLTVLKGKRVMVALVAGQSNAASHGATRYTPLEAVYAFAEGALYLAQDPLPNTTGHGGSVWSRLGDAVIQRGDYDAVVLVPLAVGGTPLRRWTLGGDLHPYLLETARQAQAAGLKFTHVLWHQGETDARQETPAATYQAMFLRLLASLRKAGVGAPVYVSQATVCNSLPDEAIRSAQRALVRPSLGIYAGPDTDELQGAYRYDGCHFSGAGLELAATLWLHALQAP